MKNNKKSRIVDVVLTVLIVLLGIVICLAVYSKITDKPVFKYTVIWVMTDSMEDKIPARSYILVEKTTAAEVNEDDIITFVSHDSSIKGEYNTHCVDEVIGNHEQFVTRGYKATEPDPAPVSASDVRYKYVGNLPVLTAFGRLYSTKAGLFVTLSLIIVSTALWFVVTRHKEKVANAEKLTQEQIDALVKEEVERLEKEFSKKDDWH